MNFNLFKNILNTNQIKLSEPMSRHTTLGIGGPADCLVLPNTREELSQVVHILSKEKIPFIVIGGGANLLVRDKGIRGVVLVTSRMQQVNKVDNTLIVEAGVSTVRTAAIALQYGLSGLEFASGIPGTIGGAAYMNAGAYGGEMSQVVTDITSCDREGIFHRYEGDEIRYAYRHSAFMDNHEIIIEVSISIQPATTTSIKMKMDDFNTRRRNKQPLDAKSAGSTFKRPEGHYVGHMIESLGLKGFSVGDASVSTKHAGFLINKGKASCKDMLHLIEEIQYRVKERYNVDIETEVRIIGEQ